MLWALLSITAGRHMVAIFRAARRIVDLHTGELLAMVREDFDQGHRMVNMLGFRRIPGSMIKTGSPPLPCALYRRCC